MVMRFVAVFTAIVLTISAAEARRVALVIGQDNYLKFGALFNSERDASMVAQLLTKHGFERSPATARRPAALTPMRGSRSR